MKRAVFLDRDGLLNEDPKDTYYVTRWDQFHFIKGVKEALRLFNPRDYLVFVATNQSGIARGAFLSETLDQIHQKMLGEIELDGGRLDGVYVCPHDDADHCPCRKPKAGLYHKAAKEHMLDLKSSFVIGDSERDVASAKSCGMRSLLVLTGKTRAHEVSAFKFKPDVVVGTLQEGLEWISNQKAS